MYRSAEDGRILYANPALERMLGYTRGELIGKILDTDIYADPTARARCVAKWAPLGRIDGAEVEWKHKDGRVLTVQLFGTAVMTSDGKRMEVWITDVTALRRPSSENASAENVTSRPATEMRVLSSTSLLIAAVTLAARSCSIGTVLFQAAKAHRMARGMRPGHHFLLHLKTLCIR